MNDHRTPNQCFLKRFNPQRRLIWLESPSETLFHTQINYAGKASATGNLSDSDAGTCRHDRSDTIDGADQSHDRKRRGRTLTANSRREIKAGYKNDQLIRSLSIQPDT